MPLLGQVPLIPELREAATRAGPSWRSSRRARAAQVFARIAETVDVELAPKRIYHSELRIG